MDEFDRRLLTVAVQVFLFAGHGRSIQDAERMAAEYVESCRAAGARRWSECLIALANCVEIAGGVDADVAPQDPDF